MRCKPRPWALSFVVLCSFFTPNAARAQTAEDRATAQLLAKDADAKLQSGDLAGAYDLFARANQLVRAPTLMLEMARLKAKLGQLVEAQSLYMDIARIDRRDGEPSQWTQARSTATEEERALAARIPTLVLKIQGGGPNCTTATIDGKPVPAAALGVPRVVNPGSRRVGATCEGYEPFERTIEAAERSRQEVIIQLEKDLLTSYGLDPVAHQQARQPLREARVRTNEEDFEGALAQLRLANKLVQAPTIKVAMADIYESTGKLLSAEETLLEVRNIPVPPKEPAPWTTARTDASTRVASLQSRIPVVTLVLPPELASRNPRILLNGAASSPLAGTNKYRVDPGHHVFRIEAGGTSPIELPFDVAESARTELLATAAPTGATTASEGGPQQGVPWPTVSFVAAGVLGGTGALLGWMAKSKTDDIKSDCVENTCPTSRQSEADSAGTLADVSTVAFILAGASLTTGIVLLSTGGEPETTAARGADVKMAFGVGTLQVKGNF